MTYIDRRSWAKAVLSEDAKFAFRGIERCNPAKRTSRKLNQLQYMLLQSDQYCREMYDHELKYTLESGDYEDDWLEYCKLHELVPTGIRHREKWAQDRLDHDWVRETIQDMHSDLESIEWFLREHPVDAVWSYADHVWMEIDEVHWYCWECTEPVNTPFLVNSECPYCVREADEASQTMPPCWPPGAPWPPRVDFIGNPLTIQPWEEADHADVPR